MKLHNRRKFFILLRIFESVLHHGLCAYSLENSSMLLHEEVSVRVGVVLDMNSWIGKSIHSFITMAISEFYALNYNITTTTIVLHTRDSEGDPLQALSAVLDLLNNIKVQVIIGPETYLEAKLLTPIANKAKVPIFSLAGSPSMNDPYLFQVKEDESVMAQSIVALVESFTWRNVIFLYEDTDCERELISYFHESFQGERIWNIKRMVVPALATDDQIMYDMQKIITGHTALIISHMSSSLASRVFSVAKRLGMISEEYAWIIMYKTIDIMQSEDNEYMESMQGVIAIRSNIPSSSRLRNLTTRWYNECHIKHPTLASREVSVLAVWAYDTTWVLAESVQRLEAHFSLRVPKISSILLKQISRTIFKGVSGEFRLTDGKRVSNGLKIVNVIGNGGSIITQKRRLLQMSSDRILKVGVLIGKTFMYFTDAIYDKEKNLTYASGFSVDVFTTCIRGLPYEVMYEFTTRKSGFSDAIFLTIHILVTNWPI